MIAISIKQTILKEVTTLVVDAQVRYWEDTNVNGKEDTNGTEIPCRVNDCWCPIIDLETGKITNWDIGKTAKVHYKVCDAGIYTLLDSNGDKVVKIDGYVPKILCPTKAGFGDYIIMNIDEFGKIANWTVRLEDFEREGE